MNTTEPTPHFAHGDHVLYAERHKALVVDADPDKDRFLIIWNDTDEGAHAWKTSIVRSFQLTHPHAAADPDAHIADPEAYLQAKMSRFAQRPTGQQQEVPKVSGADVLVLAMTLEDAEIETMIKVLLEQRPDVGRPWYSVDKALPADGVEVELMDEQGRTGRGHAAWFHFSVKDGQVINTNMQFDGWAIEANADLLCPIGTPKFWRPAR